MISMIAIPKTSRSGPGQSLTLVGYSSVLPKMIWSQAIYIWVAISLTTISRPPNRSMSFSFFCVGVIKRDCRQMVILLGAICWCREYRYIPTKCTLFQIMHRTMAQIIIQCHDNNIRKKICIKNLYYSNETYFWYNVQRGGTGQKIHMSSISRIGPNPTK